MSTVVNAASAARVPESHVWEGNHDYPVVSDSRSRHGTTLCHWLTWPPWARAAEDWGGFLLVGHGVPVELRARVEEQIKRLFARRHGDYSNGNGYGVPPYALYFSKLIEGYTFSTAAARSAFRRVWPDGGDDYQRFSIAVERMYILIDAASVMHAVPSDVMEEFDKRRRGRSVATQKASVE